MLLLIQSSNGQQYALREGSSCIVGRDNANIKICDKSISRKHALITLKSGSVLIQDLKSSNGSYVNNVKLVPYKDCKAEINANIQFGIVKFTLAEEKLIVTCTGISNSEKERFYKLLADQNITNMKQWVPEVTHVICFKPSVTKKILAALIKQQHIVDAAFFHKRSSFIEENKALPKEDDFRISTFSGDDMSVTISCWKSRSDLFKNTVFIFSNQQDLISLKDLIEMCGGKVTNLDKCDFTVQDFIGAIQHILVYSGEGRNERLGKLLAILKKVGQRTILPTEISTAILDGNVTNACNSRAKLKDVLLNSKQTYGGGTPLVDETQVKIERPDVHVVIAATATMDVCSSPVIPNTSPQQSLVGRQTENIDPAKSFNTLGTSQSQSESEANTQSQKRPADSELIDVNNHSKRVKNTQDFFSNVLTSNASTPSKNRLTLKKKDHYIKGEDQESVVNVEEVATRNENVVTVTKEVSSVFDCTEKNSSTAKLRLKRKKPSDEETFVKAMHFCSSKDEPDLIAATTTRKVGTLLENDLSTTLQNKLSIKRRKSSAVEENEMEKSYLNESGSVTQPRNQLQALYNSTTYKAREKTADSTANTSRFVKAFRKQKLVHFTAPTLLVKRVVTLVEKNNTMNTSMQV